jgi:hypothetical protein
MSYSLVFAMFQAHQIGYMSVVFPYGGGEYGRHHVRLGTGVFAEPVCYECLWRFVASQ